MKCFNYDCINNLDGECDEINTLELDANGFCTSVEYHYKPPQEGDRTWSTTEK